MALLDLLRAEAATLEDSVLPSQAEVRTILGALVNRIERLEQRVIGSLEPAPVAAPVEQPSAANTVAEQPLPVAPPQPAAQPSPLEQAEQELAAAQARVAELSSPPPA